MVVSGHRLGLVESRMRGDTHVRFGGAGRGNGHRQRGTAPRPDPYVRHEALFDRRDERPARDLSQQIA